jgi:hypothetical protein
MMFAYVFTTDGIRIGGSPSRGRMAITPAIAAAERALQRRKLRIGTDGRPPLSAGTREAGLIEVASFVDDGKTIFPPRLASVRTKSRATQYSNLITKLFQNNECLRADVLKRLA